MKRVTAVVRLNLGLLPDDTILSAEDVMGLAGVTPFVNLEPEPLVVTFTDIDTGLITSEKVFELKGKN